MRRCWSVFDLARDEQNISALETESHQPEFWNDNARAQKVMRELNERREHVNAWRALQTRVSDALALVELAQAENDSSVADEIARELQALEKELHEREFELLFGGEYDKNGAVLSIHAGAGGTEAQDWAQMLLRMYLRYCDLRGYKSEVVDETEGEEAGIKSVSVKVEGAYAYGRLKAERGVHRLVRISPFDANKRRHTSFALVEVVPLIDDEVKLEINPEDVRIDIYHASGHGGQNVQKVATAVRLTHVPTGIIVTCQNERSQLQNRETAWKILRGRLLELEIEKREQEHARLKGQHVEAGWGNAIRSYVLHPYQMVKDVRTDFETARTDLVLDGELDPLIEAYLKQDIGAN